MKLNVGNMDSVPTGPESLPPINDVVFKIVPVDGGVDAMLISRSEGKIKSMRFTCEVAEPTPYIVEVNGNNIKKDAIGRRLSYDAFVEIDKEWYLSWKYATEQKYANKEYLSDLKRLGVAIGIDFATQDVEDAFGRRFKANITQRVVEGATYNDIKNPKAV